MVDALRRHPVRIVTIVFAVVILAVVAFLLLRPSPTSADPSEKDYPVRGVDISAHNGQVDFRRLATAVDFVFIKVSEGATWNDRGFDENYRKAREAGLKVGAYHFFRYDRPGVPQAINVYNALWHKQLDLPLAIDVEDTGNAAGVDDETINQRLHDMVRFLENRGIKLMFYTNKRGYRQYVSRDFSIYPLWICSFTDPPVKAKWTFWQFTHSGRVPGIKGDVDLDVFNGTRAEFDSCVMLQTWRQPTPRPNKIY